MARASIGLRGLIPGAAAVLLALAQGASALEASSPEIAVDSVAPSAVSASTSPMARDANVTPLDQRLRYERYARANPFVIMPHRPNYILVGSYNWHPNQETFVAGNIGDVQRQEVKFEISFKFNLIKEMIKNRGDLYLAYTQRSFWQAYNTRLSSPFRETDYEPELGTVLYNDWKFLGVRNRVIVLAISHQSNGREGVMSRSWNRVFGEFLFEHRNVYLTLRPWVRLPDHAGQDDNPDILRYMGHGELQLNYVLKRNIFGLMGRNTFRSPNRGAIQADWSFPLVGQFKGYLQYFYGFGESLIDYNHINSRIGLGFILTNWI